MGNFKDRVEVNLSVGSKDIANLIAEKKRSEWETEKDSYEKELEELNETIQEMWKELKERQAKHLQKSWKAITKYIEFSDSIREHTLTQDLDFQVYYRNKKSDFYCISKLMCISGVRFILGPEVQEYFDEVGIPLLSRRKTVDDRIYALKKNIESVDVLARQVQAHLTSQLISEDDEVKKIIQSFGSTRQIGGK